MKDSARIIQGPFPRVPLTEPKEPAAPAPRPPRGAAPSGPQAPAGYYLFATALEWQVSIVASIALALAALPLYEHVTLWVGPGVGLFALICIHLYFTSRFVIPLPHMAILFGVLQLILAPWASHYFPPPPNADIGDHLPVYMAFATPVMFAFTLGWLLPCLGLNMPFAEGAVPEKPAPPKLLLELDLLTFGGLALSLALRFASFGSLSFPMLLLGMSRYVGAFGWVLVRAPGWKRRLMLVFLTDMVLSLSATTLHTLYLVSICVFGLMLYRFRPSFKFYATIFISALIFVPVSEYAKWQLRSIAWFEKTAVPDFLNPDEDRTKLDNMMIFAYYLYDGGTRFLYGDMDEDSAIHLSQRFNQGWIVNKVMMNVPAREPYANGETIWVSVVSAIAPRMFLPQKHKAGGQIYMERFAGYKLTEGTSMNLGYAGEMWANYGYFGGILACGLYALAFGILFRFLARRAALEPLWWMFLPLIFHWSIKAESGNMEVISWTAKSLVICGVVIFCMPALRMKLFAKPKSQFAPNETYGPEKSAFPAKPLSSFADSVQS